MKELNRNTAVATLYRERVIQFGEGNFLRAFVDWAILHMNRRLGFDAGVVAVQPIETGMAGALNAQQGLYHLNMQGLQKGRQVDSIELIDVITRAIDPYADFGSFLALAENPDMRFVVSNTTEAGIAFDPSCRLDDAPASSYPGKLTQLLWHRYRTFGGAGDKGLLIFPCELIFLNGKELRKCILQYAELWQLGEEFRAWFETACGVYCTLVDRIVPGYPREDAERLAGRTGYDDKLLVKGEAFFQWVIEAPESVEREFPVDRAGIDALFVPSEEPYHERKVTLLNGPHTVLAPVGYLSGMDTVRECVEDELLGRYVRRVMYDELMPALSLPREELEKFADDVLERFRNPFVKHRLTSIMLNSFSKYRTRDLPGLKKYLALHGELPRGLALGLAAIIAYYRGGKRGSETIAPNDDAAVVELLARLWATGDVAAVVRGTLGAGFIWGEDLNAIPHLADLLTCDLRQIETRGMRYTVEAIV
ncbi:altronate oxidoreductase [Bacteroidia bacterium]|nr:altronate oxidoreductase [Bacteroidia bacterium]